MVQWVHNIDGDASLLARRRLLTGARGRQCRFCRRENYSASITAASERTSSRPATSDHDDDGIATNRVATVAARPTVAGSPRDCVTLCILGMARSAARSLTSLCKDLSLNLQLKSRLMQSLIWSVATYGCEYWTINAVDRKRLHLRWTYIEGC